MAEYDAFRDVPTPLHLEACRNCNRTFNPDVLAKHERICAKLKKRKVFDTSKKRTEGLEVLPSTKHSAPQKVSSSRTTSNVSSSRTTSNLPKPKRDWRQKHEELIQTIRAARNVTAAVKAGAPLPPPPPPTIDPDYVQCPYCNRHFNESAAERHMGFCKEKSARIGATNDSKAAVAKEKLNKRTQYKPPLPGRKSSSSGQTPPRSQAHTVAAKRTPAESPKLRRKATNETVNFGSPEYQPLRKMSGSSPPVQRRTVVLKKATDADVEDSTQRRRHAPSYSKNLSGHRGTETTVYQSPQDQSRHTGKKNIGRDPQWFEDLKKPRTPTPTEPVSGRSATDSSRSESNSGRARRQGSGSQAEKNSKETFFDLNEPPRQRQIPRNDSGIDFDDGIMVGKSRAAVGVVRPSSRQDSVKRSSAKEERTPSGRQKLANFCHECGTRYPVSNAKFCCECGMKRMHIEC